MRRPFCLRAASCAPRAKWPGSWPRQSPAPGPGLRPRGCPDRPVAGEARLRPPSLPQQCRDSFSKRRVPQTATVCKRRFQGFWLLGSVRDSEAGTLAGGQEVSLDLASGSGDTGRSSGSKSVLTTHVCRQHPSPHSHASGDTRACAMCPETPWGRGSVLREPLWLLGRKMPQILARRGRRLQGQPARAGEPSRHPGPPPTSSTLAETFPTVLFDSCGPRSREAGSVTALPTARQTVTSDLWELAVLR